MRKVYAKLISKYTIQKVYHAPHQTGYDEQELKNYAEANGYKLFVETESPGEMYSKTYKETENTIEEVWTPCSIEEAKERKKEQIQKNLTKKLSERAVIHCDELDTDIIYDNDAKFNATYMLTLGSYPYFIDANDKIHALDAAGIRAVMTTLGKHGESLYAEATLLRQQVDACETVEDVQKVCVQE